METPSSSPSSSSDADIKLIGVEPVEIVSEEEMAFIEAALASTRSLLTSSSVAATSCSSPSRSRLAHLSALPSSLSPFQRHQISSSISAAPSNHLKAAAAAPDIEDSAGRQPRRSLIEQFRSRRALMVTDLTSAEWCEKQMEFTLLCGRPPKTEAMKAGSARHFELEKEVIERVAICIKSVEESWALKLMNFIVGTNKLLFEGLTRELPVIGFVEGIWMIGVIDEVQMPIDKAILNPFIVDTKTRYKATIPSEAQKRNARLQLMCYKCLWDNLVVDMFPADLFFSHFGLNPLYILSDDIKVYAASLGFDAKTLEDVVTFFRNACHQLSPSQEQLILRYELQSDCSLLEDYQFAYDARWFKNQITKCLEFWLGEREATYVSEPEKWKCRFCTFTNLCPMTAPSNTRT